MTKTMFNNDLIERMKEEIKRETANKLNEMLESNTAYSREAYKIIKRDFVIVPVVNALYDAFKDAQKA